MVQGTTSQIPKTGVLLPTEIGLCDASARRDRNTIFREAAGLKRFATWFAVCFFVAMTVALTYPGVAPFNTIRPYVLGIPFVFAWYLLWILGALAVFGFLYKVFSE